MIATTRVNLMIVNWMRAVVKKMIYIYFKSITDVFSIDYMLYIQSLVQNKRRILKI